MKIIEIVTPNCGVCKMIEPQYKEFQNRHPEIEFEKYVLGIDSEAKKLVEQFDIKSAPTFIVNDVCIKILKFDQLLEEFK